MHSPWSFHSGRERNPCAAMLSFLMQVLIVSFVCKTAGSGSARGVAVETIHEAAFMQNVSRTAKASSGKITTAG